VDAYLALKEEFNAQLMSGVLCYVDEEKLPARVRAKLRKVVEADYLPVRLMRTDTFEVANTTHHVQCANGLNYFPISPKDTRNVFVQVEELTEEIKKEELEQRLTEEGRDFMAAVLSYKLPEEPATRLYLPVLDTPLKQQRIAMLAKGPSKSERDPEALTTALLSKLGKSEGWKDGWEGSTTLLLPFLGDGPWPKHPGAFSRFLNKCREGLSSQGWGLSKGRTDDERTIYASHTHTSARKREI
jgi:hypothetical protein